MSIKRMVSMTGRTIANNSSDSKKPLLYGILSMVTPPIGFIFAMRSLSIAKENEETRAKTASTFMSYIGITLSVLAIGFLLFALFFI